MKLDYKDKLIAWLESNKLDYVIDDSGDGNATLEIKKYKQHFVVYCMTPFYEGMIDNIVKYNKYTEHPILVLSKTATKGCFKQCREHGINLLTFEGNAYIETPQMLINIYEERLRKPLKTDYTAATLKRSRIIRTLLYVKGAVYRQSDLTKITKLNQSQVSRTIKYLYTAGFINYEKGLVNVIDGEALLEYWAAHYQFKRHKRYNYFYEVGDYGTGLEALTAYLNKNNIKYAYTGESAAYLRGLNIKQPQTYRIYVSRTINMKDLGCKQLKENGNLKIYIAQDSGVTQFIQEHGSHRFIADAQLYLDLINIPECFEVAEQLKSMMPFDKTLKKTAVAKQTIEEEREWVLALEEHTFACKYDVDSDLITIYCKALDIERTMQVDELSMPWLAEMLAGEILHIPSDTVSS